MGLSNNIYSPEHDYPKLYAAAIKYINLPVTTTEQMGLVRMFYPNIDLKNSRAAFEVAHRLHQRSREAYNHISQQLTEGENYLVKKLKTGIHEPADKKADVEERIAIMLEGCSESEIRPDLRKTASILLPPKSLKSEDAWVNQIF